MKLKLITATAIAGFGLAGLPLLAQDNQNTPAATKDPMVEVLKGHEDKHFEAAFLSLMIHHHGSGVKMAASAKQRASAPELKELAAKIEKEQTEEIGKMTAWLKEWHGQAPDDSMVPEESKKMEAAVSASLASKEGKEFDRFFASKMADHHSSGVAMAKLAKGESVHKEVSTMSGKMITMQTEEKEKLARFAK